MRDYKCPVYTRARKACLRRDKKCKMPGCGKRRGLVVHHIYRWADQPHLRFEINNLITLCRQCHDSIKDKEDYYIALFTEIINARIR
jgi:5-methylcytosine-specific restriction endonuclease McrA